MTDTERNLYESAIRAKEQCIRQLCRENERLKEENRRLRQGKLAALEVVCVNGN